MFPAGYIKGQHLPVQQVKYFAGARLLLFTQWGSCKPIIVYYNTVCICILLSRPGDCQFGIILGEDKLGIQCSKVLIKASIVKQKNILLNNNYTYTLTKRKLEKQ